MCLPSARLIDSIQIVKFYRNKLRTTQRALVSVTSIVGARLSYLSSARDGETYTLSRAAEEAIWIGFVVQMKMSSRIFSSFRLTILFHCSASGYVVVL